MKTLLFFLFAVCAFAAQGNTREYPFCRKLVCTPGEPAMIVLDLPLFRNTNGNYSNIRILDEKGNAVPFAIRDVRERKTVTVYEKKQPVTRYEWGNVHTMTLELPELSRISSDGKTILVTDAANVPCSALSITADDPHFSRTVEVSAGEKRLARANITPENKEITLPEFRAEKYTVTIFNQDDAPLKNIRLTWSVKKKMIVFLPQAENLTLCYGGTPPEYRYDIDQYADTLGSLRECTPGKEEKNPAYTPPFPKKKFWHYTMWVVVTVSALLLLAAIIRLLSKP